MGTLSPLKSGSYLKKRDLFFDASKLLFAQVTEIFDFIWPTVAGMWNLRWQVNGYLQVHPDANVEELRGRFTKGSGSERANLKRACQDSSWDEQKEQFALFLLVNSFAFYESWIVNVLNALGSHSRNLEKELQSRTTPSGGVQTAINTLIASASVVMKDLFYAQFLNNSKNGLADLDNLMICYRCFKELRNCVMHNGSIVDDKFIRAYNEYIVLTASDLNVSELPTVDAPTLNEPATINLRGVVGFYDIILRLVATIDAELSVSEKSLGILLKKWRDKNGRKYSLKSIDSKRVTQIGSLFNKIDMPVPLDSYKAERFLRDNLLVT